MDARVRAAIPAVIAVAVFAVAIAVLRREIDALTWAELISDVMRVPAWRLALACLLTFANYALLTGNDFLALISIGRQVPPVHVAIASFLSYAVANSVGFAMVSGVSVRYRFYRRWGVTSRELPSLVAAYAVTFWLGLLLLGGLSLSLRSFPGAEDMPGRQLIPPLGIALIVLSAAYVTAPWLRRDPIRLRGLLLPVPSPRVAIAQLAISTADWLLAGAALYVLLPPGSLPLLGLLGAFMAAQLLGLVSHVPGGVGVFEGSMILLLNPFVTAAALLPALVVYRAVYYMLPLTMALLVLVVDEWHQRRAQALRLRVRIDRLIEQLTPRLLSVLTFAAGLVLLFSGATPSAGGRLGLLQGRFPLGVLEISHFTGSVAGAGLLVLAQGIGRRLDAAYFLSVIGLTVGIAASLLKGGDYEEATALGVVLVILWRARGAFGRRAELFDTRFGPGWIAAIVGGLMASVWLGLFAFRHVEYSNELWWQFELHGEASRFLRASIGAAVLLFVVACVRLLGYAAPDVVEPSDADLESAAKAIAKQGSTVPYLVYLRDKALLFDDERTGFVMYGVQRRTWVALGDPVAPAARLGHLVRLFLERCNDFGGAPVFYQISKEHLHRYADFGLAFVKLGEEARVDLPRFTLEGGHARKHRQTLRRLEKQQVTFRVAPASEVGAMLDVLREVSDDWLHQKQGAEKGFSLGFFERNYLQRFPVAVMERDGRVIAFANLWPGPTGEELSADLMRYRHDAPEDVMEGLILHVLSWGKDHGYRSFSLGMAPLSGFETSPVAPLWSRMGSFLYKHGDAFYHFQGLRAYKEKFHPEWEPRYLVYSGRLMLPRILADVAALVAGGYRRIVLK